MIVLSVRRIEIMKPVVVERKTTLPEDQGGGEITRHLYWCPGCDALHGIAIRPGKQSNGASWSFEGTLDKPTYWPSQLTKFETGPEGERREHVCHTFIRDGVIQFLDDSTHVLAGQAVPLPPVPDWVLLDDDAEDPL
jgi:hypothetical protein